MNLAHVIEATIAALTGFIACWGLVSGLIFPRLAVWALYIYVWFTALVVVWVGVVLALAGWVWPKLFGSEAPTASPKDKIVTAAIAAILLYVGKQLLELRHVHIAEKMLKMILMVSFKARVPNYLKEAEEDDSPARMAYRALYVPDFVISGRAAVEGWGPNASCLRVELITLFLRSI
jgi:hypothetical protein